MVADFGNYYRIGGCVKMKNIEKFIYCLLGFLRFNVAGMEFFFKHAGGNSVIINHIKPPRLVYNCGRTGIVVSHNQDYCRNIGTRSRTF